MPERPREDIRQCASVVVCAVGTLAGKEAALAVWTAHEARFRAAFVDAPELESVRPNRREK